MPSIDETLIVALMRTTTMLERPLTRHIAKAGFTPGQFAVLETLLHKGPRTINQIIDDLLATSGNISVVIENLISAGILKKESVKEDRRKRLISLTPLGESKIRAYYPDHKAELHRLTSSLQHDQKQTLVKALLALRQSLARANQQSQNPKERLS